MDIGKGSLKNMSKEIIYWDIVPMNHSLNLYMNNMFLRIEYLDGE